METAVVSALHGAMGSLIGKLAELLTGEYKLVKGVKGQVLFLKAELESIHVFLKKISDTEQPDEQDKCWAKEVRELSYDIEDSVSEFMARVEQDSSEPHGFKGFINRCMKLITTMNIRREIEKEFEGLKVRVIEARERRMRYQQTSDAASRPIITTIDCHSSRQNITTIHRNLMAIYAEALGLVAIEGPRDELIQLMDAEGSPAHQLKVISIVGFGGLGKTTLAKEVYRKVEGKFQCRAFVSVSQKPNIRKLLRTMLSQVGFKAPIEINMETWDESELIAALRKFLLEQRYFIVIDDIWEISAWDIIRCALPGNINSSRVVITTRIETVARACCANNTECVYKLKALSDQDSGCLFFKRIFGSEEACPPYLKDVSAQILKKCGGLPLAIITTSSLIASEASRVKEHWEYVRDSLGSNFEISPSLEGMRQILNLSYINLPHYLKACLLYLGIYPEDYTIFKNDLARRWIAEGFICKAHGIDHEDIAKGYFNELINRSLIQPADRNNVGEVISCKVHDMMLDLILHKSREVNFVTVIDDIRDLAGHQDQIRRLSLNLDGVIGDRVAGFVQLSQVRTLTISGTSSYLPPFQLFKHLRVLGIEIIARADPPLLLDLTKVCHLFQLRSLKIIAKGHKLLLPSKIGSLQQLETLEIDVASTKSCKGQSILELPSDIIHLSRLLHLIVPYGAILPNKIGNMKSLHTLRYFNLVNSPYSIRGLRELTNLTYLQFSQSKIRDDEVVGKSREVLRICLEKLSNLKYLDMYLWRPKVYMDELSSMHASFCYLRKFQGYMFSRVPRWIIQLHHLNDLCLIVRHVIEEDVGILTQLPSLVHLYLHIQVALEDKISFRKTGFPVLKHFTIAISTISCIAFEKGAMAKLEKLDLCFNAQGWHRHGTAPAGLEHLLGLKEISVNIGSLGAMESEVRAAESVLRNAVGMHPSCPEVKFECPRNSGFLFEDIHEDIIHGYRGRTVARTM